MTAAAHADYTRSSHRHMIGAMNPVSQDLLADTDAPGDGWAGSRNDDPRVLSVTSSLTDEESRAMPVEKEFVDWVKTALAKGTLRVGCCRL